MRWFGFLNINKPSGYTSREVVDRVQWLIGREKAGHAGTLDPLATGVLMVGVGRATRLIEYIQRMPKRYRATFLLGQTSPSDDMEGEVTPLENPPRPTRADIEASLPRLIGHVSQRPPAYSAVHVDGRRAYELARRGKRVELAPRMVEIHSIEVCTYQYPELVLEIVCGSGTYVRSIGRDLAELLGTGAVMSALVRRAIGQFTIEEAVPLDDLTAENLPAHLIPAARAVSLLPSVVLEDDEVRRVLQGGSIRRTIASTDTEWAALDAGGTWWPS
jgi:tRNA pseudouridine55 synthase